MKCLFAKGQGNVLVPAEPNAEDLVASVKVGDGLFLDAKKARNIGHHRKFFSLLQLAFDIWEPAGEKKWKGEDVRKDFERFREDITILAGHYTAVYGVDGSVRLIANSISFANCDEHEFSKIYNSVLDVVWERILKGAKFRSKEEVDRIVMELMAYG